VLHSGGNVPEYIIKFGESLDSNEKVLSAALQVMARLTPNASDAEIHNAIIKAGMESWALDSLKQPPMSDCKAVYSLIIQVLNRGGVEPDARQAKIEELARQRQDALKKEGAYLSDQKEADFFALLDEIEELYPGTNRKELLAYMEAFAAKIKDLQRRQGLRPCRTEDCIRIVEGSLIFISCAPVSHRISFTTEKGGISDKEYTQKMCSSKY
jgi:hypothetical protein